MNVVLSCEHASNRVPDEQASLFGKESEALTGHRAYDLGAAPLARFLAKTLEAPLFLAPVSRLVVDCNRSPGHPALFSKFTANLPPLAKEAVLAEWYLPYRSEVYRAIRHSVARTGHCLHLSVHTFTPELKGRKRDAELGLLYDPSRPGEHTFSRALQKELGCALPACRVRRNYPYRGVSDGLTAALRQSFPDERYRGIELEVNQALLSPSGRWPRPFLQSLGAVLQKLYF